MDECWANKFSTCEGKISREHLVSNIILDDIIHVEGLSWCKNEIKTISSNGLVSKILCQEHNWQLSQFDSEVGNFSKTLTQFDRDLNRMKKYGFKPKKGPIIYKINGELFEKWFCKTLVNLCLVNQKELSIDYDELLPYIFGDKKLQKPYGLNFAVSPGQQVGGGKTILEFAPLINEVGSIKELAGGLFVLKGYYFIFLIPCSREPIVDNKLALIVPNQNKWNNLQLHWHLQEMTQPMILKKKSYTVQKIVFRW